jgi:hypothetical protein
MGLLHGNRWGRRLLISLGTLLLGLAVLALYSAWRFRSEERVVETKRLLDLHRVACSNYHNMFREWPRTLNDLRQNPSNIIFLAVDPPGRDAWNNPLQYAPPSSTDSNGGVIRSLGADGKIGGGGRSADLEILVHH